jgi:hypothetical protein
MTQTLFPKHKKSFVRIAADHDQNNLITAREILADVEKWGGEEAGIVAWARAVVKRLEGEK